MSMTKRIQEIDYLRAVSMILIILYHYTTRYEEIIGHQVVWSINVPWGCFAVNTFFVLTGYLTFANLNRGGVDFLKKRVIRLYPTFWACILITSLFMAIMMPERLRSVKDIAFNFTMFPGLLGAQRVDGVYWTLQVEMIFYLLVSVITVRKSERWRNIGVGCWIGAATVAFLCKRVGINPFPIKLIGLIALSTSRFEFLAAGVLLALLEKEQRQRSAIYLGLIICSIVAYWDMGWIHGVLWLILTLACIALAVNMESKQNSKSNLLTRALVWLAQISYPVYLLHQFIGFAILRKLDTYGMTSELYIFIPIVFSLLLGALLHKYVEIPSARFYIKRRRDED